MRYTTYVLSISRKNVRCDLPLFRLDTIPTARGVDGINTPSANAPYNLTQYRPSTLTEARLSYRSGGAGA